MNERELKLKSIVIPAWKFKPYYAWHRFKNHIQSKFKNGEYTKRNKWFYFSISNWKTFSITWQEAGYDEDKAHINLSIMWIHLYIYTSQKYAEYNKDNYDHNQGEREYGIKIHNDTFWIYKGLKNSNWEFPYTYTHIRHSVLKKDKTWEHDYSRIGLKVYKAKRQVQSVHKMKDGSLKKSYSMDFWDKKWDDILYKETFDFQYIMKSGKIQNRKATIKIEKREWRRKFLVWTKWKNMLRKTIDIEFDKEVGERSGSWKGGTIGMSFEMKPGETAEQCLRRFERIIEL